MFIDTWAWVEYFEGTEVGERVRQVVEAEPILYTSPMVIAEVRSKYERFENAELARERVRFILGHAATIEHDQDLGLDAGAIHAELRADRPTFGMADAFILAAARSRGVPVLTGDPHFEDLDDARML